MRTRTLLTITLLAASGTVASLVCWAQSDGNAQATTDAVCDSVGSISLGSMTVSLSARAAQPLSGQDECALKPRDAFKECDGCPEMIVVPSGSFTMGSPESEVGRSPSEGPAHRVTFARPFAVGRFAVTFDEWEACAASGGCNAYHPADHEWGRGRHPVIYVSWNDAKAYVDWLSRKTGKIYRLLSEAEWEYVARAGTQTPFWFGSSITAEHANYDFSNSQDWGSKRSFDQKTMSVDSYSENPWGLYQVHGNVSQWTEDCHNDNYQGAPTDGSAWTQGDCSSRVLRGGSLDDYPKYLRAASRNSDPADIRTFDDGFRVARTLGVR